MKKKLISLIAASSMIATASLGLVQTAYAADPNVRIEVADGADATKKVLTFYYEGADLMNAIQGTLSFNDAEVTIDSITVTIANDSTQNDVGTGIFFFTSNDGTSSSDGSFATVNITIPENKDITASFELEVWENSDFEDYASDIGTVTAVVSQKQSDPTPVAAAVTAVEKQESVSGTEEYKAQTADIYGVEITPNDESVTGAEVAFGEKKGTLDFGTVYSGEGTVVFAVILASESGDALPTLAADNVTPITANVE